MSSSAGASLTLLTAMAATAAVAADPPTTLEFRTSRSLAETAPGLEEPSGLALSSDGKHLWTVSDDDRRVFAIDTGGEILSRTDRYSALRDPEGVAVDALGRLLVVSEARTEIIVLSPDDGRATRHPLKSLKGYERIAAAFEGRAGDDGLEGISIRSSTGHVLVIKERAPRLLVEISADLDEITLVYLLGSGIGFASPDTDDESLDVSGIAYDASREGLWILSDTDGAVFFHRLGKSSSIRFPLPGDLQGGTSIDNPEGIAISPDGASLWIVTDDGDGSRLLEYAVR